MLCDDLKAEKIVFVCRNIGNFLWLLQKGKKSHNFPHLHGFVCVFMFATFKRNKIAPKRRSSLPNDRKSTRKSCKDYGKNSQVLALKMGLLHNQGCCHCYPTRTTLGPGEIMSGTLTLRWIAAHGPCLSEFAVPGGRKGQRLLLA